MKQLLIIGGTGMLGGAEHPVSRRWSWVGENFNYSPYGAILVASREYNPILKSPEEETDCHRDGKEFHLDKRVLRTCASVLKKTLKSSQKRRPAFAEKGSEKRNSE